MPTLGCAFPSSKHTQRTIPIDRAWPVFDSLSFVAFMFSRSSWCVGVQWITREGLHVTLLSLHEAASKGGVIIVAEGLGLVMFFARFS